MTTRNEPARAGVCVFGLTDLARAGLWRYGEFQGVCGTGIGRNLRGAEPIGLALAHVAACPRCQAAIRQGREVL